MRALLALLSLLLAAVAAPAATVTLSEVLPDPDGRDDGGVFVELRGPPDLVLHGYVLRGRNGRGGGVTHEVDLGGVVLPDDGLLVVADGAGGVTRVSGADLVVDDFDLQNGPDSVQLLLRGVVVDALAYGTFGSGDQPFGEGRPAPSPGAGRSLARSPSGADTDDNRRDFRVLDEPTPGRVATPSSIPEPGTAVPVLAGVLVLAGLLYRKAARRPRAEAKRTMSP
jgi:hypothetical protein